MNSQRLPRHASAATSLLFLSLLCIAGSAQVPAAMLSGLRWRLVGPFRGGRVLTVTGVPSQPETYYFGSVDGGVWKTTDAGRVWSPLWRHEPVASIGAIAVAPSAPERIYAGAGEADMRSDISLGGGLWRSDDGGRHWQPIGLRHAFAISRIVVDPRDPNLVLAAVLGDPYGPSATRGVFRSADGGRHWTKVLYKNADTGAVDLVADPGDPQVLYAALWQVRRQFWSGYAPLSGPGGGIYKSTDEGRTWRELSGHGLPAKPYARIGLAVAGRRVYAIVRAAGQGSGLYRSGDAGAHWRLVCNDPRILLRSWYFNRVVINPANDNDVYVSDVSLYRSTDGGVHFSPWQGAPGGNDYHDLWIDPSDPAHRILGSDQGTEISVDGGQTWSSWYNQPTGQFYHVAVDRQFPYRIYGAQQDSGAVTIASRGNYGAITSADWGQNGGGEAGYLAPDPLDPDIVYGSNYAGGITRFDARTGQVQDVSPAPVPGPGVPLRFEWSPPLLFSPINPHELLLGAQFLLESDNGGESWRRRSGDLTAGAMQRPLGPHPSPLLQNPAAHHNGTISAIAPSPLAAGLIWVGTDNGLIQLTRDGGHHWRNVTPAGLPAWSAVRKIAASPFAPGTAYAAVNRRRLDDRRPYIYRTRDYGRTWRLITQGLAAPGYVHAVVADPVRRGLLFAGTETGVAVSFDNGAHWQSLQKNLPTVSVRDLAVAGNDLVAATHGRALWVLDDISPLRHLTAAMANTNVVFLPPAPAVRLRRDVNADTPLPPEVPMGQNPPDGAILDYYLQQAPSAPVRLDIYNAAGQLVRRLSSQPSPRRLGPGDAPDYWFRPPVHLSAHAGLNRVAWSLRYPHPVIASDRGVVGDPPTAIGNATHDDFDYNIAAVPYATPRNPRGPLVVPGVYTLKLLVGGRAYTQKLTVTEDPRVHVAAADLNRQLQLELQLTHGLALDAHLQAEVRRLFNRHLTPADATYRQNLGDILGAEPGGGFHLHGQAANDLIDLNGTLATLYLAVSATATDAGGGGADAAPTVAQVKLTGIALAALRAQQRRLAGLRHGQKLPAPRP